MTEEPNIILQFRRPAERILSCYVLDEFSELIGFKHGSLVLFCAGYRTIGDVHRADPNHIRNLPGIGERKLRHLDDFFEKNGLSLPVPFHARPARQKTR